MVLVCGYPVARCKHVSGRVRLMALLSRPGPVCLAESDGFEATADTN